MFLLLRLPKGFMRNNGMLTARQHCIVCQDEYTS